MHMPHRIEVLRQRLVGVGGRWRTRRYISELFGRDEQLDRIDREADPAAPPSIGADVARYLEVTIASTRAIRVMEVGTAAGYSTVTLARAVGDGGEVLAVEIDPELAGATRTNLERCGLSHIARVITGDAAEVVPTLEGPFDLILLDGDKAQYPMLLEACVPRLRLGGLLIADNALFPPRRVPARFSEPVDHYNKLAARDPRLKSTLLPIGDGLMVSVRTT